MRLGRWGKTNGGTPPAAADRAPADVSGATVRGLHDAGPTAGHHREPGQGEAAAHFAAQLVVRMGLREPRRTEHGHAGADEVQGPEAAQELQEDAQRAPELEAPGARAGEERPFLRVLSVLAPLRIGGLRAWRCGLVHAAQSSNDYRRGVPASIVS